MASHPASAARGLRETDSSAFYKVAAMLLGLTLAVVSLFALFLWSDARSENASVPASTTAGHDMAAWGRPARCR